MKNLVLCLGWLTTFSIGLQAQSNPWIFTTESQINAEKDLRLTPGQYKVVTLDTAALLSQLAQAPQEGEGAINQSPVILSIPLPDGSFSSYYIVEYQMMEPELSNQYPHIKTYRGQEVGHKQRRIRLDWTERGLRVMTRTSAGLAFIDPYSRTSIEAYFVYLKKDYMPPAEPFQCHYEKEKVPELVGEAPENFAGDCQLRTYRLAMATTGEYSNYHGAANSSQSGLVLSEITTAVNRVNEVYEVDVSLRMILIGNTADVFYYDGGTDPFTNNNGGVMLNQNQNNMDNVIGSGNYDIGHVFSTGGGGIAQLNAPCGSGKARGVTGLSNPINDPFYIDYVAHEMGHQFGGNHTQNNSCNRNGSTAMEPGSASTIMGYAGICSPNVQNNSDAYFHGISVQEISNFITGSGNSCATILASSNNAPTIIQDIDYIIPQGTPFRLTAMAADADGDTLTYCWEQFDNEVGPVMPPASTNSQGPMFRTFDPVEDPSRYFPALPAIVAGTTPTWEVLASVSRLMDFRVTVRDNNDEIGCTTEDDLTLTVDDAAGPFVITSPNGSVTWTEGQQYLINWDVANTDQPPVNCSTVDVYLSTDGGLTFPTLLAAGVSNVGAAYIPLPAGTSSAARIMVICSNNVFLNVNGSDITITSSTADYSLGGAPYSQSVCSQNSAEYVVDVGSFGNFSDPVSLSISGQPAGTTVNFTPNPVTPGTQSTLTISNLAAAAFGNYTLTITANSSTGMKSITLELELTTGPVAIAATAPINGQTGVSIVPTFSWNPDPNANSYLVEVATDVNFTTVVASTQTTNTSWTIDEELAPSSSYYWRVQGQAACIGPWNTPENFETAACTTYISTDVPVNIPTSVATVSSDLTISETGSLLDVNVIDIQGTHTWVSDLTLTLISPDGIEVDLVDDLCGSSDDFDISLNEEAANTYGAIPCNPLGGGGTYQPLESLAAFNGEDINGTWVLEVVDDFNADGGQLTNWGLRICAASFVVPVSFVSFDLSVVEESVLLEWETFAELNNLGFEIERRLSGEDAYTSLGWLDARGNEGQGAVYSFIDATIPKGVTGYYRLKQMDMDGSFTYSPIRSAKIDKPEGQEVNWWPNPAMRWIRVQSNADHIALDIRSLNGQLIQQNDLFSGEQEINIRALPPGIYLLQFKTEAQTWTDKVIIQQ